MKLFDFFQKYKRLVFSHHTAENQSLDNRQRNTYASITHGLSAHDLAEFNALGVSLEFAAGTVIFHENDEADNLYIVLNGEAEVFKQTVNQDNVCHTHLLATLKSDDVIGDMALLENKSRSTSLRAKTALTLLSFNLAELKKNLQMNFILTKNIALVLSARLRYNNEVTIKSMEESLTQAQGRNALGVFMIALFWLMCLYTLSLRAIVVLTHEYASTTPLSVCLIFFFAIGIVTAMRLTGLPYSRFGISTSRWFQNSVQALMYTAPFMLLFLIIKVCYVYFGDNPQHIQVFSGMHDRMINGVFSWRYYLTLLILYSVFSPIQELITRCAMQTTFFLYLPGSEFFRKWNAIILSNLIFSTAHSHLSFTFAALTFIPGLFWGCLFHKQRSLVGVSFSHILLGVWVVFIIGGKGIAYS